MGAAWICALSEQRLRYMGVRIPYVCDTCNFFLTTKHSHRFCSASPHKALCPKAELYVDPPHQNASGKSDIRSTPQLNVPGQCSSHRLSHGTVCSTGAQIFSNLVILFEMASIDLDITLARSSSSRAFCKDRCGKSLSPSHAHF